MGTPRPSPPGGPGPGGQTCISESPGPGWAGESWNPRGHEGWSCWPGSAFRVESAQPSEACVSSWRHSPAAGCVGRCSPTGWVLGPFRLLSRMSSESRLLVKTLSSPLSRVLPYHCLLFSFLLAFFLQGARKTTFVNVSCLSLEEAG